MDPQVQGQVVFAISRKHRPFAGDSIEERDVKHTAAACSAVAGKAGTPHVVRGGRSSAHLTS